MEEIFKKKNHLHHALTLVVLVARLMPNSCVFIRSFMFSVCNVDELIKAQEPEKYLSSQRNDIPRHYKHI